MKIKPYFLICVDNIILDVQTMFIPAFSTLPKIRRKYPEQ